MEAADRRALKPAARFEVRSLGFVAVAASVAMATGAIGCLTGGALGVAGMVVGVLGVLLLVRGASFSASPVGLACIAGAVLMWSLGSILQTTKLPLAPGAAGFASEMLCGGAVLMLVSLALGEQFSWPPAPLKAGSARRDCFPIRLPGTSSKSLSFARPVKPRNTARSSNRQFLSVGS